jgi:hypothetical protein
MHRDDKSSFDVVWKDWDLPTRQMHVQDALSVLSTLPAHYHMNHLTPPVPDYGHDHDADYNGYQLYRKNRVDAIERSTDPVSSPTILSMASLDIPPLLDLLDDYNKAQAEDGQAKKRRSSSTRFHHEASATLPTTQSRNINTTNSHTRVSHTVSTAASSSSSRQEPQQLRPQAAASKNDLYDSDLHCDETLSPHDDSGDDNNDDPF